MNKYPIFLLQTDWTTLRHQKSELLKIINELRVDKSDPIMENELTGILHFIDAAQDYAVDVMGIPEMSVYDFEEEESRED